MLVLSRDRESRKQIHHVGKDGKYEYFRCALGIDDLSSANIIIHLIKQRAVLCKPIERMQPQQAINRFSP